MRVNAPALLALFGLVWVAGCGDDGDGTGRLTLMLTDDPGDVTTAIVAIERIELAGGGPPLVVMDTPTKADLTALSNDVVTLVSNAVVPTGRYSQLRLIIPGGCIEVEEDGGGSKVYSSDGFDDCGVADGPLRMPSFDETGIKVNLPGGVIEVTGEASLLLDFSVVESFGKEAGSSGAWVMTPVIHAEKLDQSANLTVELQLAEGVDLAALGASPEDFRANIDGAATSLSFSDTDGDGTYSVQFLFVLPNTEQTVTVGLREGVMFDFTLDPESPQSLSLEGGEEGSLAFEITSAGPSS